MFGAKGGGVIKKARASTPPSGSRAGMATSSPGGDPDSAPQGSKTPARRTVNGITALKYIPFSMDEFLKTLTPDQKRLLQLECETLNKSWQVFYSLNSSAAYTASNNRLKVLKDELTKPYFIKLKEFLWEEGVKDPDTLCPKIYPPGSFNFASALFE
jgi:uracil-DNA glycosylase